MKNLLVMGIFLKTINVYTLCNQNTNMIFNIFATLQNTVKLNHYHKFIITNYLVRSNTDQTFIFVQSDVNISDVS